MSAFGKSRPQQARPECRLRAIFYRAQRSNSDNSAIVAINGKSTARAVKS